MKKFLFKIVYSLKMYRLAHLTSPSLYFIELTKDAHADFYMGLNEAMLMQKNK